MAPAWLCPGAGIDVGVLGNRRKISVRIETAPQQMSGEGERRPLGGQRVGPHAAVGIQVRQSRPAISGHGIDSELLREGTLGQALSR